MKVTIYGGVNFLPKEKDFETFIYNMLYRLSNQLPSGSFIFLSCGKSIFLTGNASSVRAPVPFLARPVSAVWCNKKLLTVIEKNGADIMISLNGRPLPVLIRQIIVVSDAAGEKTIKAVAKHLRSGKRCSIITSSVFMKEKLVKEALSESDVFILPQAPGLAYRPVDWERRESVKNKHAAGREYFLMSVSSTPYQHILNTLKAFSQFKKWQQSNMQLILWGDLLNDPRIQQLLPTYKYREDVKVIKSLPDDCDYADIVGSCLAMIYFPGADGSGIVVSEAMQCGTPVITTNTSALSEIGGDAVLYCDPKDIKEIASNIMKLYKDEKSRNALISKGRQQVSLRDETIAAERLWNYIRQVVTT